MPDDVQLTDLVVIQRYSLAVRGATASRAELVQALESDLAWLTGNDVLNQAPADGEQTAARRPPARRGGVARPGTAKIPARQTPKRTSGS
jgi:hypothetical protein